MTDWQVWHSAVLKSMSDYIFLNHQLQKKTPPTFEEENALPKRFKAQKIVFVYYLIDFLNSKAVMRPLKSLLQSSNSLHTWWQNTFIS